MFSEFNVLFSNGTNQQSGPYKIAAREQFINIWKRTIKYLIVQGKFREKEKFVLSRVER